MDRALIDTGADVSVLPERMACDLDLKNNTTGETVVDAFGGGKIGGRIMPVTITVDGREAQIDVFVPTSRIVDDEPVRLTAEEQERAHAILGHDFLQAARAKLDYSQPHANVFGGIRLPKKKISKKLAGKIRALAVCRVPAKPKKRR